MFRMPSADHRCLCDMQMEQITGERRASIRDRSKLQRAIRAIPLQHAQGILRNSSTYYTCPALYLEGVSKLTAQQKIQRFQYLVTIICIFRRVLSGF